MIYNLSLPYAHQFHLANLMTYISFRAGLAIILSLVLSFIMGPKLIRYMRAMQSNGQPIREDGPESHFAKAGTPTMGGIMILASSTISSLIFADWGAPYVWIVLFVMLMFGLLGFIDDYTKVSQNNYRGISGRMKLICQLTVSVIAYAAISYYADHGKSTYLVFPFLKNFYFDLGYLYFPFAMVVIVGSSNAVNLTDGLDGLAIGTTAIAVTSFALICYLVGNSVYANYLQITYMPQVGELAVICSAIIGSSMGFLWYNSRPAEIFMGDTGSLALGGTLGVISVIVKHEIVLAIIGGVFVIETISVMIQVLYYKKTGGKSFFLMAPIHHHFEKKGWPESKVVIRFWILAIIFALIGLSSLKLR